jgi:Ran GTPase-activating protein (RanGAP) involved in mRNA processing and transport
MLSRATSLRMLRLSECQLTDDTMRDVIASGLRFSPRLTHLDVSSNKLDTEIGVLLSQALLKPALEWVQSENQAEYARESAGPLHLFFLDLSRNLFATPVAVGFSAVLSSYPFLGYLDLSTNGIDDDGVTAIASALETNQTLVELHLAENRFTSVGGKALSQSLRVNQTLTTLNISKNNLGDDTACEIADALQRNTVLTVLLIASAWLSDQGGIRLAQASRYCPSLLTLDMSDNFFTEDAGTAMESLFAENLTILKINVSGTQINHFSFHALSEICERNAAMLKQKKQRPLRNQLIKSQYSLVELERKEAILANLVSQKNELQEEIDRLDEQIHSIKSDEHVNASMLSKQILEKRVQIKSDRVDFEEKMKKMQEDMRELDQKKTEVTSTLESQLTNIKETRAKTEERKAVLNKMTNEFETQKAKILQEIHEINSAADELLQLSQDPDALAAMDELPEFLAFAEEKPARQPVPQPESEQKGKVSKTAPKTVPKTAPKKKASKKK